MVTAGNSNVLFNYKEGAIRNSLKNIDSDNNLESLQKYQNNSRSRIGSSKVSPHMFTPAIKEEKQRDKHTLDEEASENFDDVNEALANMEMELPKPNRLDTTRFIVSPALLSEASSKSSFRHPRPRRILKSYNNIQNSEKNATITHPLVSSKPSAPELLKRAKRKRKGTKKHTKPSGKPFKLQNKPMTKGRLIIPKLRSTTPSQLFVTGCLRKDLCSTKNKGSVILHNKSQIQPTA